MNMTRNCYRSKASQINKRKIPFRGSSLAGDQGFEPQFPRPERGVLPLHQSPNYLLADPESAILPLDEPPLQRAVLYHARLAWASPFCPPGVPHLRAARRVLSSISRNINRPLEIPCKPKK